MHWSALVGGHKTDKSAAAQRVVGVLRAQGLSVGGFLQRELHDAKGESAGWDVVRVDGSDQVALARPSATPELCTFTFDAAAFSRAAAWALEPADVVVLGGVGKLEAEKKGHFPVLAQLTASPRAPWVLACVRDSALSQVGLALPDAESWLELPCDDAALLAFAEDLARRVRSARAAS